ncbi:hypothetical protein HDU98_008497, partial [Podochytrium sp. JEL0797]
PSSARGGKPANPVSLVGRSPVSGKQSSMSSPVWKRGLGSPFSALAEFWKKGDHQGEVSATPPVTPKDDVGSKIKGVPWYLNPSVVY